MQLFSAKPYLHIYLFVNYEIPCDNVNGFVSDNAAYMVKAFSNMKGILPNAVHVTCKAHILNLVGESW